MKRNISLTIIIGSAAFFGIFSLADDLFIHDDGLRQICEDAALGITLAIIGITGSKYFSDTTTETVLQEVNKMQADFKQRLEKLESEFKQNNKSVG